MRVKLNMIEDPKDVVNEQAEDEALWFIEPLSISESMLQTALRRLHAAVEKEPWEGQRGKFAE